MMMTTIKRTIVILLLLAIAFFIYRGISPSGAEHLITRIKTIYTTFVSSGTVSSGTVYSGTVSSGTVSSGIDATISTGQFLELTGEDMVSGTIEQTGFIEVLSDEDSGAISTGGSLTIITGSSSNTSTGVVPKPASSSSASHGLSSKDIQDTKAISNLFK